MAWASGGQHVGRPKADDNGEHPGGPVAEAQVGIHACVSVCKGMCICMCACTCVYI